MKICSRCKVNKDCSEFNHNYRYKDGYYPHCRACNKLRKRYNNHSVTVTNKTCITCGINKHFTLFRLDDQASDGLRGDCRDCFNRKRRARENTPEGRAMIEARNRRPAWKFSAAKSSALKRGIEWTLTKDEYCNIVSSGLCSYDGEPLPPTGSGLDRVNNNLGYTKNNVVPCCQRCNAVKSNYWSHEEMIEIGKVFTRLRELRTIK